MERKSVQGFMNKTIPTQDDKGIVIEAKLFSNSDGVFVMRRVYIGKFCLCTRDKQECTNKLCPKNIWLPERWVQPSC
jgi:hypothetical protein